MTEPVVLCILDGWGLSARAEANAPHLAHTPNFDRLIQSCPNATLTTHGPDVGLPRGQMGNSEVGHTNIGAGRVVAMDLGQIDLAIEDGSFAENAALDRFIARLQDSGGRAHLMGLVSDGGVHGHIAHIAAAARIIRAAGVPVVLHAITDGRDVAPRSARSHLASLIEALPGDVRIVTVTGRYFAMDRDNRWSRVQEAYEAMVAGHGQRARDARSAVTNAYARSEGDEFISASVIGDYDGVAAFFNYLSSPEVQADWHQSSGYVPITTAAYELSQEQGFYEENPGTDTAIQQLSLNEPTENSRGLRFGNFVQVRDIINEELENLWAGNQSAETALEAAAARGNALLRDFEAANN